MEKQSSVNYKTFARPEDTRNNWVTFMFVTKCRFNCFKKKSHIETCTAAFHELEKFGFEFADLGFGGNHVHFLVNIPKGYSVEEAEILLKSRSARRIFEKHSGFRKRYPRGSFWSGYEHHESTGKKDFQQSADYIRDQERHHKIEVINDLQQKLKPFMTEGDDAATSESQRGLAEGARPRGL